MMSSRRSRIKVIANIPQRRKQAEDLKIKESSSENTKTINSENTEVLLGRLNEESNEDTTNVQDSSVVSRSDFRPNQSKIIENGCYQKSLITEEEAVLEKPRSGDPNKDTHPVLPNVIQDNNIQLLQSKVPLLESSQTLNLKYSQNFEGSKRNDLTKHVETDNITKDRRVETIQGFVSEPSDTLPIANDTLPISSDTIGEKGNIFQRPTLAIATHSDTEYSLPPPSPNKANRSRIKAIPRLAHRKTSFSASESEDESRKINRIRNDSVILSHRSPLNPLAKLSEATTRKPEVNEFNEHSVTFVDGSEEIIDDVIFCTGYLYSYPFLSKECNVNVEKRWVKYVYKHVMNINHPTMAFIGLPFQVFPFVLFGIQVRFFLAYLKGNFLKQKDEMMEELLKYLNQREEKGIPLSKAHYLSVAQGDYMDELAETAGIKKVPSVYIKLYKYVHGEGKGKHNISYKILNSDEFTVIENY